MRFSIVKLLLSALPASLALPTDSNTCAPASQGDLQHVKQAFTSAGLVPDYISSFNPKLLANITYTKALGGTKSVNLGNTFNSTETLIQPTIFLTPEKNQPFGTTYSLFFINFDNPNPALPPAAHLPFLHWQQSGLSVCNTSPGNTVQLFIPSAPPSVAPDRYTYLIFREPLGYVPNPITTTDRIILNVTQTAASQGLVLVGGNYFLEGQIDNVTPGS